jgi:hypothetical protein
LNSITEPGIVFNHKQFHVVIIPPYISFNPKVYLLNKNEQIRE